VRGWAEDVAQLSTTAEVDRYLRTRAHERLRDFLGSDQE